MNSQALSQSKKHLSNRATILLLLFILSQAGCKNNSGISELGPSPQVRSTDPQSNALDVPINSTISARFSDAMDPETITGNTFKMTNDTTAVTGTIRYADSTATFTPAAPLGYNSKYTATITGSVKSLSGSTMDEAHTWSFSTAAEPVVSDTEPPQVTTTNPSDGAEGVSVNTTISITFSEPINGSTINTNSFSVSNAEELLPGTVEYEDNTASFIPDDPLPFASTIAVSVSSSVEDTAGNALGNDLNWSFTTDEEANNNDTEPPQTISTNPINNATDVSVNTTISVTFNEPINGSTINTNSFSVSNAEDFLPGTVEYENNTASFIPDDPLPFASTIVVSVSSSVEDTAGNALGNDLSWSFTTEANPDNTPPEITATTPADGQEDVAPNTVISATFNEPMNPASINSSTFTLHQGGIGITGTITYTDSIATFTPSGTLAFGTQYTAAITGAAEDLAGNSVPGDVRWNFTTGTQPDETPPQVTTTDPANRQEEVAVNSNITATFSEPLDGSTINNTTFTVVQNGTPIAGSVSYSGLTAIFNPSSNLPFGTPLDASISSNVQDLAGNNLTSDFNWRFFTAQETTPPTIASVSPDENATDIAIETDISVTFSEPMDPTTISAATFTLLEGGADGTQVDGTITYSGNTAIFSPSTNLSFAETYMATVTTGVQDVAGNSLENDFNWTFSTAEEPDNTAPEITTITPPDGATEITVASNITAAFSEPMNPASIESSFSVVEGDSPVDGSISYSGTTATFTPSNDLAFGSTVTAAITTAATDLAGNALASDFSWTFTTVQESTPPEISSVSPPNNASNVSVGSTVTATFNEAMDPATIDNNSFILSLGGTAVAGTVSYAAGSNTATFTPSTNLALGTTYTATITTAAQDLAGNALPSDEVWTFTTELESTPPEITAVTPVDGATDVAVSSNITAEFSEEMDAGTINTANFSVTQNGNPISGTVSYSGTTATFTPNSDLAFNTSITATITTAAADLAGNNLPSNVSWSFTTAQESTPPTVTSTNPADNAQNVQTNISITANFSEAMDPATINETNFTVSQDGAPVAGAVTYSGTTAIFTPNANLPFASTFTATITTGAQDLVGNPLANSMNWTFSTEQESQPPSITSTSPTNNAIDVPVTATINAVFSEPMDPATIDGSNFVVSQNGTPVAGAVSYSGNTATFTPEADLAFGTSYLATVTTGVADVAGNNLQNEVTWTFTTADEPDNTAPEITAISPENNQPGVAVTSNITATFSEDINPATLNNTTFTVTQNSSPIAGTILLSGTTATFDPITELPYNASVTATVSSSVQDLAGNALGSNVSWSFTTEQETTPPSVTSTNPPDNATGVQTNTSITATFSEPMDPATINGTTFTVTQNGTPVSGNISYSGTTAIFTPTAELAFASTFTATITTGATDLAGNALPTNESWSFTTAQETTPPQVTSTEPTDNQQNVPVTTNISATFSEPIDPTTINSTTFTVTQNGSPITGSITLSGTTASFNPTADLAYNTSVTATVSSSVQDLAGNALGSDVSWSFTTEQETTPPSVTSTNPTNNATEVPIATDITATFSEPMDPATINGTTFTVTQNGTPVSGNISYSGTTAIFTPTAELAFASTFTATITTGATDLAGNALTTNESWSFTTAQETTPPQVTSTTPLDGSSGIPVATNLSAVFSEPMDAATINSTSFVVSQNGNPITGAVSYSGNTATFNPADNLPFGATITATITTDATDLAGNALTGNVTWNFSTEQETTPPQVTSTNPLNNATDVPVTSTISATFDEAMDPATINRTTFSVNQNGTAVGGSVSYDQAGNTATFTPASDLALGTQYVASITTGATDLAGNALDEAVSWNFSTEQESVPPQVVEVSPVDGDTNVVVTTPISVTFSEPLNTSTVNATTFSLALGGSPVDATINYSDNTATLTPLSSLSPGSTYTATVTSGITDLVGNTLPSDVVWSFTTAPSVEVVPPLTSSSQQ